MTHRSIPARGALWRAARVERLARVVVARVVVARVVVARVVVARVIPVIPGLLLLLASCGRSSGNAVEATGTLEVVEVSVSPLVAARVERVLVAEGAVVRAGDTLAMLTLPTLRADVMQREARAAAAGAVLQEVEQGARPAELARAESELAAAEADAARAGRDAERLRGLADRQVVSAQQFDAARAIAASSAARRDALRSTLSLLREGARSERVRAVRADARGADAAMEGARAIQRDLVLLAPVAGTVTSRAAEPGEVVAPGQAVLTIGETRRQTVRVFVSQAGLSFVQTGQRVHAELDAFPGRDFEGRVVAISTQAEFTPRVALTEKERADLLFGVKVEFADTSGVLKAGLPITVHIEAPVRPAKP